MKKFLALAMISLLVLSACSPKEEAKESSIETTEELPINEDKDMDDDKDMDETSEEDTNMEKESNDTTSEESSDEVMVEESMLLELTLEQLKAYDGTNGNPAYIAIDGKIYDVSVIPNWDGGSHNGFKAGNDLTKEMKEISPHGVSKLQYVQEVGIIIE